jgi:hypothetical protein
MERRKYIPDGEDMTASERENKANTPTLWQRTKKVLGKKVLHGAAIGAMAVAPESAKADGLPKLRDTAQAADTVLRGVGDIYRTKKQAEIEKERNESEERVRTARDAQDAGLGEVTTKTQRDRKGKPSGVDYKTNPDKVVGTPTERIERSRQATEERMQRERLDHEKILKEMERIDKERDEKALEKLKKLKDK